MLTYAGIGSREITESEKTLILNTSGNLADKGWIVYSGNADGSDVSFQRGSGNRCVVFLPWGSFNQDVYDCREAQDCFVVGECWEGILSIREHHPNPETVLSRRGTRALMTRNYYQVMGYQNYPRVRFVLCCADPDPDGGVRGGTGQAVRIAGSENIPVVNIREEGWEKKLEPLC